MLPADLVALVQPARRLAHGWAARAVAPRRRLLVSEWADGPDGRRLSTKGSAISGRWRTDANPPLREPMDSLSKHSPVHEVVLKWPIQFGKALALDTPIPTPSGWTTMGAIVPGDIVFGEDGLATTVVAASEVFLGHACYRVQFSDGSEVIADAGHRWRVVDLRARNEARREVKRRAARTSNGSRAYTRKTVCTNNDDHHRVLTTAELTDLQGGHAQSRFAIEVAAPLALPQADLAIDPYLLGCWLGDGTTAGGSITTMDAEIIGAFSAFDPRVYASQSSGRALTYGLRNGFITLLRRVGVLGRKHIPAAYLRASAPQRLALLQGLMDTDGHASGSAHVEITSSMPALADDIVELVRSLGFKPTVRWRETSGKPSARITFGAFSQDVVFRLPRKLASLKSAPSERGRGAHTLRYITAIEPVQSVPTRCIAVDNSSHLFLCGRAMVPTHNTEIAVNWVGYIMDHDPGPTMVCLPGEASLNKWIAQKLNPAIEESASMRRALTSTNSRESANQKAFKDFAGGQLYIEHAGSPARLKSNSVEKLIVDELDEFAAELRGGDDPVEMLEGRTSAFPVTGKKLYISSPQIEGRSRIDAKWKLSDQRRYYVPCPHCGHMQPLEWGGLHWSPDASEAWYCCRDCACVIQEHHKPQMIRFGRWVAENPGSRIRGYHINCLYYQFAIGPRWAQLAAMWLAAQNDPAKLKVFVNDRLAETWEDPAMRAVKHNVLRDRAEPYTLRTAPEGVLAITAGVDTQDDRLEVQIVGWGRGLAAWTLDYHVLTGDPANAEVWADLVELLNRPIEHVSGVLLQVEATAIDTGGHRGEAVKTFVRSGKIRRPMAIFGAVQNNAPVLNRGKLVDVKWDGKVDPRGLTLYQVGTVAVKHLLYSRIGTDAEKQPDARLVHISDELPAEYFTGLVSETYNPSRNRFEKRTGARNEPLDTWGYAYAATHHPKLRLHRLSRAEWDARAARLVSALKASPDPARPPTVLPTPQRGTRRGTRSAGL